MKKYIVLFLLINSVLQGFSQEIKISEEILLRTEHYYEIIGRVQDKILLFKNEMNEFSINVFDNDLKEKKEKKIKLGNSYLKYIGITVTPDFFTILFSHKVKGDTHLEAHRYDSNLKLLDSTVIKKFDRRAFAPTFTMVKSQNKQVVLLYNVDKEKILETIVFDIKNMEVLSEHRFEPLDFYFRRDFINFLVGNDGSSHLILERDNERLKKSSNRFEFYSFYPYSEKEENYTLDMSEELWYDIHFEFDNLHQKIVGGGLYANDLQTKALGYFYLNISPKNTTEYVLKYTPFDDEFIQNVVGKGKPTKKEGFAEVDIREVVLRSDGGILLIAERNREYVRQTNSTTSTFISRNYSSAQIDYYYDDLLVFSINPTGDLHWKDILYKKQYSQDDEAMYSSYFLLKTRNNLRFLYNDEVKQENVVNEYIVTGEGMPNRKNIMNTQGTKLMLVLKDAVQISADEVIIPSERHRELKLVKLTY